MSSYWPPKLRTFTRFDQYLLMDEVRQTIAKPVTKEYLLCTIERCGKNPVDDPSAELLLRAERVWLLRRLKKDAQEGVRLGLQKDSVKELFMTTVIRFYRDKAEKENRGLFQLWDSI